MGIKNHLYVQTYRKPYLSTPKDLPMYKNLRRWFKVRDNIRICSPKKPERPCRSIGEDFIGSDNVAPILGDNIFHDHRFTEILKRATKLEQVTIIFGYYTNNHKTFGVVEFNKDWKVLSMKKTRKAKVKL